MRKILFLLPFLLVGQQALAVDSQDEQNYRQHYAEQLTPLVIKKLSADRPEMAAAAVKREATSYVDKMATCQLQGLSGFPENYREQAILPVANGKEIGATTQALNAQLKQDIKDGKISEDKVQLMIQTAQETVQVCLNT